MTLQRIGVICVLIGTLTACGGQEQSELREWMQEQAKGMRGGVPPLPEIQPLPAVAYEGKALIVPFSPLKIVTIEPSSNVAKSNDDRPKQPLENYAIEDLKVQGIIVTSKRPYALIQPKGPSKPMHVGVGEFVGQNYGKVMSITQDAVTVLETIKDNNGNWTEREVQMSISRQGGSK